MIVLFALGCQTPSTPEKQKVKLITLDPGHFHAALVQKSMYDDVDSVVHVYAQGGKDLDSHLEKINTYNSATQNPTGWKEEIYTGKDFLAKMLAEKKGNVVVIAGNNFHKTEYIKKSVDGGFHVLADKPMAIDPTNFDLLVSAFAKVKENHTLLYDIMTERYEITNILMRELMLTPNVFGSLEVGTPDQPSVEMESVHYFYKYVSGKVLTRPSWFMDVSQQGEGITDVAVHLVDLVQWSSFPNQTLDYQKDIQVNTAKRWSTDMNLNQFSAITKLNRFPDFLKKDIQDDVLKVYANGEINYQLKGIHVKIKALWDYQAKAGGDTHYALFKGTKAHLFIKQTAVQDFKPTLYIEPVDAEDKTAYEQQLLTSLRDIQKRYEGVTVKKYDKGWEVVIPEKYRDGHEAHFAQVTTKFLGYLKNNDMPTWEIPNMIAKYYTTTQALVKAK